ncbi:vanadium-dependent haloperoxidase (plasmid) [Spirosoma sp. SC4-14]|uniref:vanadium-dependent haloperoxidase n=1 Tax=Spirosoma sp. SC4-14 TaxID=3128900 RepID=UPI0030CB6820
MKRIVLIFLMLMLGACQTTPKGPVPKLGSRLISELVYQMTDIMVHDVTNPPLAARFFSYACLAGYEVVAQNDRSMKPLNRFLRSYPELPPPTAIGEHSYELSALLAMVETGKKLQPSGFLLEKYQKSVIDSCMRSGFSKDIVQNSLAYANYVSAHILKYAKADKYNRISNYPRYSPLNKEGSWYPTPPGYYAPVEPYFNTVRPFTLDTCSQFKPVPPVPFSSTRGSEFYALMDSCYQTGLDLNEEQKQVAAFWDCNPFALENNGHLLYGVKKISPGAHWLGITGIACEKAEMSFPMAMKIHTVVSVGLMDSFIACWDEKFRSNRIRPETAIRKYIDSDWKPFLQTPPFPEYLSGHSTISAASATVLTFYFGKDFAFTDTVEKRYGLTDRSFNSFHEAANEAAISRYYGGIHFMDAITNGLLQGEKMGEWILQKVEKDSTALTTNKTTYNKHA